MTVAMGFFNKNEQYQLTLGSDATAKTAPASPCANVANGTANPKRHLWHRRFGHLGCDNAGKAAKIVTAMSIAGADIKTNFGAVCEPCVKARMQLHQRGAGERATEPLERLCVDFIGPDSPTSGGGANHALSLTDACTYM